ncbi:MAG TPA: hypothetical protein VGB85_31100 [Nannocystis sp.]
MAHVPYYRIDTRPIIPMQLVLLDMNIFVNISERDASEEQLVRTLRAHGLTAVRTVELIQEAARLRDADARLARVRVIHRVTKHIFDPRLLADTHELRDELRIHRRSWLRLVPARAKIVQLQRKWRQWLQEEPKPDQIAALAALHQEEIEKNKTLHKELRSAATAPGAYIEPMIECSDPHLREAVLAKAPPRALFSQIGDDPALFAQWMRYHAREWLFEEYRAAMFDREFRLSDLADYLEPYLGRPAFRSVLDWARFCFVDAAIENCPRKLLAAGVVLGQQRRKFDAGNVGDVNHTSYLRDVDVFLTSDKNFAAALGRLPPALVGAAVGVVQPNHADLEDVVRQALRC